MKKYVCKICGYVYDPADNNGVAFEDLPDRQRHLPGEEDDEDLDDEDFSDEDEDEEDEDGKEIFDESEE